MSASPLVWGTAACRPLKLICHTAPLRRIEAQATDHPGERVGGGELTADVGQPTIGAEPLVGLACLLEQLPCGVRLVEGGGEQARGVRVAAREGDDGAVDATGTGERLEISE
jgi:hypothetical protein